MTYRETLKWAKETLGLAIKGQPKKSELEKLIAQVEVERKTTNDPAELRAGAKTLREIIEQMAATAQAAEERAGAIEGAQAGMVKAGGILHSAFTSYRDAVALLTGLGLPFEWPSPLTAEFVEATIAALTPPPVPRQYIFELDGPEFEGRAVVAAFNFSEAKAKALAGDILEGDRPDMEPGDLAELQEAMEGLVENGRVEHMGHTLTSRTM